MSASDQVLVPASATLNTPLRVRMLADYDLAPLPTACGPVQNGQGRGLWPGRASQPIPTGGGLRYRARLQL